MMKRPPGTLLDEHNHACYKLFLACAAVTLVRAALGDY